MSLNQIDLRIQYQHKLSSKFTPETFCMAELYWSFLKKYDTKKVKKCNINVSDNWGNQQGKYTDWSDCKGINVAFDFEKYFSADVYNRKKMLLDVIHLGMLQIAKIEEWEINPLEEAYKSVIDANLEYSFDVGKLKTSPNRKLKIGFICNWEIDKFELFYTLFDKSGNEIQRKKVVEDEPYKGQLAYYLKWKWLDNENVLLEDKFIYGDKKTWEIRIEES